MSAIRTKPFKSGNSQAVRLPKSIAFPPGTELEIERNGDLVILRPVEDKVAKMWALLNALPKPSYVELRDMEEIPEPKGL